MFRPEKYVKINGIQISNNGFKNLSFETSKFSNSISAIRGFGTTLDENNLNIIDTLSLEFYVDVRELDNFAYIYSLFKAYGALPIENDYILNKLKSSLAFEKSIVDFKDEDKKKQKEISHLIVLLQQIHITSLEKTNNGYRINMIFTLHKNAFSRNEYETFQQYYEEWNNETNFKSICNDAINKQLEKLIDKDSERHFEGNGSMNINIYNIEKLNAKHKNKMYLSALPTVAVDEDDLEDKVKKEQIKRDLLIEYENIDSKKTIKISNHNIAQIELITNNIISHTPIYGEPIGFKSYLGIGPSTFTVKMIFDENDADILDEIKTLSDKNTISHKIELEQPLVNMFDFHSASINNIIFNNIEQANGVMVTIVFKINSYNYFEDSKLNYSSIFNFESQIKSNRYNALTGFWLEGLITHLARYGKKIANGFTQNYINIQDGEKKLYGYSKTMADLLITVFESYTEKGPTETGVSTIKESHIGDFLSYFTSPLTSFRTYNKPENINPIYSTASTNVNSGWIGDTPNNLPYNQAVVSDITSIDFKNKFDINVTNDFTIKTLIKELIEYKANNDIQKELDFTVKRFYNYCDMIACFTLISKDEVKDQLSKLCSSSKGFINDLLYNSLFKSFITVFYNTKSNMQNYEDAFTSTLLLKEFYEKLFFIMRKNSIITLVEELKNKPLMNSAKYVKFEDVYSMIEKFFDAFYSLFKSTLSNDQYITNIAKARLERELQRSLTPSDEEAISTEKMDVEELLESLSEEYKKVYEDERSDILDLTYNIFLSKYAYGMAAKSFDKKTFDFVNSTIEEEQYLKIILLSSTFMSILLMRTSKRTDVFGLLFENATQKIAEKFSESLYRANRYDNYIVETNSDSDYVKLIDQFKSTSPFSHYKNIINWSNVKSGDHFKLQKLNKDYNFFYGKQIENLYPEKIIDNILNYSETNYSNIDAIERVNSFIEQARIDFINDDAYADWINIDHDKIDEDAEKCFNKKSTLPTFAETYMRKIDKEKGDKVSSIMKKRIIGNRDPFKELENISNVVGDGLSKIIPDYNIIVFNKKYHSDVSGVFSIVKLSSMFSVNNMISVSISKNSSKKIKTAIIKIVDIEKQIINNLNDGSINIITNINQTLDFISISSGDRIEIDLGYSDNKKNVFKGFIDKLNYYGNILEITCNDVASALYNTNIDKLELDSSFKGGFKLSEWLGYDPSDKSVSSSERGKYYHGSYVNNHLFNYNVEDGQDYNTSYRPKETSGVFSASICALFKEPATVKKLFDSDNLFNKYNLSTMKADLKENLTTMFGNLFEASPTDISKYQLSQRSLFNFNNLDNDYDTYGIKFTNDIDPYQVKIYQSNNFKFEYIPNEVNTNYEEKIEESKPLIDQNEDSQNQEGNEENSVVDNTNAQITQPEHKEEQSKEPVEENKNHDTNETPDLQHKVENNKIEDTKEENTNIESNKKEDSTSSAPSNNGANAGGVQTKFKYMPTTGRKIVSIFHEGRKVSGTNKKRLHRGVDIVFKANQTVNYNLYAVEDGIVEISAFKKGNGNYVVIKHPHLNIKTWYLHMKHPCKFKQGQKVEAGKVIGTMGKTGGNYGVHLHFEVHVDGMMVDPLEYLGFSEFEFDKLIGQTARKMEKAGHKEWVGAGKYIDNYLKKAKEKQKDKTSAGSVVVKEQSTTLKTTSKTPVSGNIKYVRTDKVKMPKIELDGVKYDKFLDDGKKVLSPEALEKLNRTYGPSNKTRSDDDRMSKRKTGENLNNDLTTSEKCKKFIKKEEGLVLHAYLDKAGIWTIGYGHTGETKYNGKIYPSVKKGMKITESEANELLENDLKNKFEPQVKRGIKTKLTQEEFDAFVTYHFNTGAINSNPNKTNSDFQRYVNERGSLKMIEKALKSRRAYSPTVEYYDEFGNIKKAVVAKPIPLEALIVRRHREWKMFADGVYE